MFNIDLAKDHIQPNILILQQSLNSLTIRKSTLYTLILKNNWTMWHKTNNICLMKLQKVKSLLDKVYLIKLKKFKKDLLY